MSLLLTLTSAVAWTLVYAEAIRIGWRERTYALPAAALALNLAWEWLYAGHGLLVRPGDAQTWVDVVWGLADLAILVTFLRWGRRELPSFVSRQLFVAGAVCLLLGSAAVQLLFVAEFGFAGSRSAVYSSFLQNLVMSGLFVGLFLSRGGPRGQSVLIAVAKWLGTLAPTLLFGVLRHSVLALGIGLLCSVTDLAYLGLLLASRKLLDPREPPAVRRACARVARVVDAGTVTNQWMVGCSMNDVDDRVARVASMLTERLGAQKVHASGPGYDGARRRLFSVGVEFGPALVVTPQDTADVRAAVLAAVQHGVTLSVLSGGNDWSGRSVRGAVVIDLVRMQRVVVDGDVAVVQGGATLHQLADAAEQHGLAAATGTMGRVGVAGLTLAGGYGPLTGRLGLALDNLLGAEVVLADGRVVSTNAEEEPDLFWALRGGGGNFGVVTSLRIQLHAIPTISTGVIAFGLDEAADVISRYGALVDEFPDELTETPAFVENPDGGTVLALLHAWSGDEADDERVRDLVAGLGHPVLVQVQRETPAQMLRDADALVVNDAHVVCRTVTLPELGAEPMQVVVDAMRDRPSPLSWIGVHPFHGAPERVPVGSTSFGIRRRHVMVGFYALWREGDEARNRAWADAGEAALQRFALESAYPNYFGADRPGQAAVAYGPNAGRLLELKARFDPDHVFSATSLPSPADVRPPTRSGEAIAR